MTFTITEPQFYLGITGVLLVLQVYQYYRLEKIRREQERLWDQISTFVTAIAIQILDIQKQLTNKEEKQDKE